MTEQELINLLDDLRKLPSETEWFEFKEAKSKFNSDDIGKYFSALSNEANLKGKPYGWLIFGIEDKTRNIVGTKFKENKADLDKLKFEITNKTTNRLTFEEIYELYLPEGRVILFQIPPAREIPIAWDGKYYGRDGGSLVTLKLQEIYQIARYDWSAQTCEGATISDLEPKAIEKARLEFKRKFPKFTSEADPWDDLTFLNKAKIAVNGKITNTAIILLGKEESEHFIFPSIAKISWILKDEHNTSKDYEHFRPPFLLNVDSALAKIRNLRYRYLPENTLFPEELDQYDNYVIREALNNCIAHQDYKLQGGITVIERPEELVFTNVGSFIPESIEAVIEHDSPQEYYRNRFLVDAMCSLNMIDVIGSGIIKMFINQRNRRFPLPSYSFDDQQVTVKIFGKILNEKYTNTLINHTDITLKSVMCLDKVQKGEKLTKDEFQLLKSQKLIEGRYPNLFISSKIAVITDDKAKYIRLRAFDDDYYKSLIIKYLTKYNFATRKDIDELLMDKLPDVLSEEQKKNKMKNLIAKMSKGERTIKNIGSDKKPQWVLNSK